MWIVRPQCERLQCDAGLVDHAEGRVGEASRYSSPSHGRRTRQGHLLISRPDSSVARIAVLAIGRDDPNRLTGNRARHAGRGRMSQNLFLHRMMHD